MTDDDVSPRKYLERARDDPDDASVDDVAPHLRSNDGAVRKAAANALYEVAKAEPTRLVEGGAVPELVAALDDDDPLVRESVAMALADVAEGTDALAPFADALAAHLDDEYDIVADYLAYALQCIAASTPAAVVDTVPDLLPLLDTGMQTTQFHVSSALVGVARERPAAVRPAVEPLLGVVDRRDPPTAADDRERTAATGGRASAAVSGGVEPGAESGPGPAPASPDGAADDLEPWVVEGALTVLATMAAERPADTASLLRPHVSRLFESLDDPHAGVRAVAAGVLAAVAEYEPEAVEPATDRLAGLLTDHATTAAGSAAWALRYVDTPRSRRALREADPDDDDVRAVVDAALGDLEG